MSVSYEGYDDERGVLLVRFEGGEVYAYSVSKSVAEGFRWADAVGVSGGQYFHDYIKPTGGRRVA